MARLGGAVLLATALLLLLRLGFAGADVKQVRMVRPVARWGSSVSPNMVLGTSASWQCLICMPIT